MGIKKYKNPPVVEAWIDFRFEYGEQPPEWNGMVATDFLKSFNEFKKEEYPALFKKAIKVNEKGSIVSEADLLVRLKAFNKANDRCLQIEQNLLVYNILRNKNVTWPGFSVLLSEAMPFYQAYIDKFHPIKAKTVLHYRDHVAIPFIDNKIEPKDYFEIYPKVPEDKIGNMVDYSLSLILSDICENGVASFSVRTEPEISDIEVTQSKLLFIIDWDVQSRISFACENLDSCGTWLNLAHSGINKAFESCLTERCRSLFY
ncbi:MAG: TIGR04255 family protein [Planctomycetes bacterium]|nr:TIGR04255 family protein [Planctomycetota bacterium]